MYNTPRIFLKMRQLLLQKTFLQRFRSLFYYIDAILLICCRKSKYESTGRKKVLVVYNMGLGDGIMFYGVSKSMREIWPNNAYQISIACHKTFKQLYESCGIYDNIIPLDFSGSVINIRS